LRDPRLCALWIAVVIGCRGGRDRSPAAESSAASPFAAVSGVTRPGAGNRQNFKFLPLKPMSEDVEILYGDPEKPGEQFAMRIR